MLIEFSVKNFLSFKDEAKLSLVASNDRELEETLIRTEEEDFRLNKVAVIYGANASGKSNLIKAIRFMQRYVMESFVDEDKKYLQAVCFKLDLSQEEKPSVFEISFIENRVKYTYGFSLVNSHIVDEEWLYAYPKKQSRLLFNRKQGSDYNFGSHWKGDKKKIIPMVRQDSLFISVAAALNNETAQIVTNFFRKAKIISANELKRDTLGTMTRLLLADDEKFKKQVLSFLSSADLGIKDISIKDENFSKLALLYYGDEVPATVRKELEANSVKYPDTTILEVSTIHDAVDREGKPTQTTFSLKDESDGTQKLFALSGLIGLSWSGSLLVIDELDAQVHTLITRGLVRMFQSSSNASGAQLVFSSHDAVLLDQELLRRDQIWFTEKNKESASHLYSLWDFKPRKGENLRKGYLLGNFGAIPILGANLDFIKKPEQVEENNEEKQC